MGRQSHQCHISSSRQKSPSQHNFERTASRDIIILHNQEPALSKPGLKTLLRKGHKLCPTWRKSENDRLEKLRAVTDCFLWTVGRSMIKRAVSQHPFCPSRAGACSEARKMAKKSTSVPSTETWASHAIEIASDPSVGQLRVTTLTALNLRWWGCWL